MPRDKELFYGAKTIGWTFVVFSFLLMKFHFFQFYYPEIESVARGRRYGYNIKSQLIKLLIIFSAVSALAAWICSLF